MSGKITGIRSRIGIGTAVLIGLLLIAIPVAGAAHNAAYAAGNATQSKEESWHGNKGNGNGNQTSYGSSNEHRQYGNSTGNGSMGDEGKGHSKADEKRMEYASETAQKRHKEHISMHSSTVGPYAANMNYTLTADGTARSVSDNSTSISSSVSLDLSVWKSTKGLVSMDIMKGTINIGNETIPVHNGHAYYLIHNHQFRVLGFIVDKSNGNQGNETASTNLKVLKLVAGSDKTGKNVLPTASSDAPLKINILSPQSKLASEWFLKMDGEVKLG
jgi:hypothetical protein